MLNKAIGVGVFRAMPRMLLNKRYIGIITGLFACMALFAQSQKRETEHISAKYSTEAESYAVASLEILEAVWNTATNNGYHLPERIKISIRKSDRNALYINRKNLKEINWEYENLADFLPPDESKKNNIYGLCHEMGHLCMFNTNHNRNSWMSYDYREAWADYFGNVMVDSLYRELGTDIWPESHNFKKFAGMEYFLKRIEADSQKLQSFNGAGQFWYELGAEVGFSNIHMFFDSVKAEKVDNPGARKKFVRVVEGYMENQDVESWFEQYSEYLIIDKD